MKKLLYFSTVVALTALPFATLAAQELMNNQTWQLREAGTVSANNARNLDDLQNKLAEKAREQGAAGFVINSAGGDNHMYGTATIYK